jgi:hypothetical protein
LLENEGDEEDDLSGGKGSRLPLEEDEEEDGRDVPDGKTSSERLV